MHTCLWAPELQHLAVTFTEPWCADCTCVSVCELGRGAEDGLEYTGLEHAVLKTPV